MSQKIIYTKHIGPWISFAAHQSIIRINGEPYAYEDIKDFRFVEETGQIRVYDYLKVFAAEQANKYVKSNQEEDLTKEVLGLKKLQIIFDLKDGQSIVVDFIKDVENDIVVDSHQYHFYKDAFLDAKKSLAIMQRKFK